MLNCFEELAAMDGVITCDGLSANALAEFESHLGFRFPRGHANFLRWSDGVESYHGYFRVFGISQIADRIDALLWNEAEYWKFAWKERCASYWCFGETAWGDQYAFANGDLRDGKQAAVWFLDALSMTSEIIADSFDDFIEREFLRNARQPYDKMIPLSKDKFGHLTSRLHLVYMPSPLIGGSEAMENVQTLDSRVAMIANGDLALQLDYGPSGGVVRGVDTYDDQFGRTRLRVIWE